MTAIQRLPPRLQQRARGGGGALRDVADGLRPGAELEAGERAEPGPRRDRHEHVVAGECDAGAQVAAPRQLDELAAEHAERAGEAGRERVGRREERGRPSVRPHHEAAVDP